MVVKNQIKLIKSLQQKKYRTKHSLFVVEGMKTVQELLKSHLTLHILYATDPSLLDQRSKSLQLISERELRQMSSLKNPNKILGVFCIPEPGPIDDSDWVVALDGVADPGNLGTIIRLCDWFGIQHLFCSNNTVDCYNPKVLQATMGSIVRVNVVYGNLNEFLERSPRQVYGTFMEAASVNDEKLPKAGILVMGNEANGISEEIEDRCTRKIGIPRPFVDIKKADALSIESLNVATATAIFLNEIRRK